MRAPLPLVDEVIGHQGKTVVTFRHGIILPKTQTDCLGTVTIRDEVRVPIEAPMRFDNLGNKNSQVVPPTSGHRPQDIINHDV